MCSNVTVVYIYIQTQRECRKKAYNKILFICLMAQFAIWILIFCCCLHSSIFTPRTQYIHLRYIVCMCVVEVPFFLLLLFFFWKRKKTSFFRFFDSRVHCLQNWYVESKKNVYHIYLMYALILWLLWLVFLCHRF